MTPSAPNFNYIKPDAPPELESVNTIMETSYNIFLIAAIFTTILFIILFIILTIAIWKIFKKAGQQGWKSIIPVYNIITLFKITGLSSWWVLGYLASIIPVIGVFISLGISIYLMYSLAKAFGKNIDFTLGLIFLSPIFLLILAFGNSEYQLNN